MCTPLLTHTTPQLRGLVHNNILCLSASGDRLDSLLHNLHCTKELHEEVYFCGLNSWKLSRAPSGEWCVLWGIYRQKKATGVIILKLGKTR